MFNEEEKIFFCDIAVAGKKIPFGLPKKDRRSHMYIVGKTGMGKTSMMENMIIQDIHNGNGIAFIDPHGDTAERLLHCIPSHRINDVVYFNPADLDYPVAFNVLEKVDYSQRHLVASGLMGVFTKIWANVWSSRMEYILNNTILALLEVPGNTLLGISRMLSDELFRDKIVKQVKDPLVKYFWENEFANYKDRYRIEAIAPIQNKIGQFLSSSIIRNIIGQTKSTIDLRKIMDEEKILILNLSKGRMGEHASSLLGAMIVTKLQITAMSRVDTEEDERKDFYLYVDEFQNFSTESFADILSEARKYRLNLILANQYMYQLDESVKNAVLGNVGTIASFRIGPDDAQSLSVEFYPHIKVNDLVNLPKYHIYVKSTINGDLSKPFFAKAIPPVFDNLKYPGHKEKVIKVSRERYSKQRDIVEQNMIKWFNNTKKVTDKKTSAEYLNSEGTSQGIAENGYKAFCDSCGKLITVSTQTDEKSGFMCRDCASGDNAQSSSENKFVNKSSQGYNDTGFNIYDYVNNDTDNSPKSLSPGETVRF